MSTAKWQKLARAKKREQLETIPKEWILSDLPDARRLDVTSFPKTCGLLTNREMEITESEVNIILSNLATAAWSAVEVTTAFSKRAVVAQQLVNCLTEVFIDRALTRAAELDEYLKRTGKVVGPLHGLPVSLKDQICIKGVDSTIGYISWIGQPAKKNAVLTDILESLGAILYVKTNIPQTLMWGETYNHIFGRTVNPYNRSLGPGGSSGGEGALVGLRGSPLGVGSDIGGSIRIPSSYNGLYGLRPSFNRIPYAGCVNTLEGQTSILSVLGPMTTSLDAVKLFMKSVIDQKPWLYDPLCIRKAWNDDEYKLVEHGGGRRLCFAILWDDGVVMPHPPVLRGLEMTKRALMRAGHKVVDWKPICLPELYDVTRKIFYAAGEKDYEAVTIKSGEPILKTMGPSVEDMNATAPAVVPPIEELSAYEYWQVNVKLRELRQAYLDHWRETVSTTGTGRPVDAIIAPVAPYVAPPHGAFDVDATYTTMWNVLDYPACAIPVSKFDPTIDVKRPRTEFYSDADKQNYETYEPETFKNAPIGVQVVGQTLEDEAVVAMSEIVDNALKALANLF